ncbi:MAG: cytochrome c [Myxococcales bacterium]|nr:cytochrome c [Myxococcales bacterium]
MVVFTALVGAAPDGLELETDEIVGELAPADLVEKLDTTVTVDGSGLPPGGGSVEQGEAIFAARCAACHGLRGRGGPAGPLVADAGGAQRAVNTYWPYATTLFDYVRRAMPYDAPGSLSDAEVYAVVAMILAEAQLISRDARLDAGSLPEVRMPGRSLFP